MHSNLTREILIEIQQRRQVNKGMLASDTVKIAEAFECSAQRILNFMYRRPTLYPLEIAVDFLKSL